uniref:F-box containing protein n=1 Tax=Marseillevirus sp. TaxID=2809551 RepID=A0AA96EMA2_9VIRU|nr:F-box containing protein [Marseillevirus sp.]
MEHLPTEMHVHILSFLGAKEVVKFCALSKWTRELAEGQTQPLSRNVECNGNIAAEKLGGLYTPNNEPLEKERENMTAKFRVDPFGRIEGKLEFFGEYGSRCSWTVRKGVLHGPFRCVMDTPYDYALIEEGSFRRGKLHGTVHYFEEHTPKYGTWTTWFKGVKKRVRILSKNRVRIKEWRTFRTRKTREKFYITQTEKYCRIKYSGYSCSGVSVDPWSYISKRKKNGLPVTLYTFSWFHGESYWRFETNGKLISEGSGKNNSSVIGRCCEKHGKNLEAVISGDWKFDYDNVFE